MQRHEQVEHLVQHLVRGGVVAVNLVDDHDRLGAGFERLAQHETRLRLRAVRGIHHQQHAVDHVHDALDFAAEIRVAGSVHDVDVVILVFERGVLGANGDALFALEIHRIHDALFVRLAWLARKVPDCFSRQSTSVVLPWSTWAIMAMFRMCSIKSFSVQVEPVNVPNGWERSRLPCTFFLGLRE